MRAALAALAVAAAASTAVGALGQKPTEPREAGAPPPAPAQPPQVNAKAWILFDPRDGAVLDARAPDRKLPIASATKLMTAYVTLQRLKPSRSVRAAPYQPQAAAEILLGLEPGQRVRVRDLLYGLLLPSANDAAHTLAVGVSRSEPAFVAEMNRAAQQLGLANTSFANPIGLDDPNNFSSARDLAVLSGELLQDQLFARIVDTPAAVLHSGGRARRVETRNTLLEREPFVSGVKTGHTLGAGYVLVGSASRNSTTLISAVLGAPNEPERDADTLELLNYGFSLYRRSQPVEKGEELADPALDYRSGRLSLVAERAITVESRRGQQVATAVEAPDEVAGAVEAGQRLGRVVVTVDGEQAASAPLVAAESVDAASLADKAVSTAQNPVVLLPIGGIVIVVGMLLAARGRRPEHSEEPPAPKRRNERRERAPRERTPEERRRMHEERMRRRRQRMKRQGGSG